MATRQQRMDAFIHENEKTRLGQETLSFKGAIRRATDREVVVQKIGYVCWDKPGEGRHLM
jgi:hypothetical protein